MKAKLASISLLLFACAIPLAIFLLPIIGLEKVVGNLSWHSPFYIFTLQFAVATLLFIKLFKDFANWLKTLDFSPKSLALVFTISLAAALICLLFIEGRSRVQMDESHYLATAQNLYHSQVGTSCDQGAFNNGNFECINSSSIKPKGISYLYMLGMPIFGTDLRWVYNFQTFILFLTLPIFFLAILAWTKKQWLALLTITLLANCPVILFCSRSASIEGLYVFMFALSLLLLKWVYDRNTTRHWILLALTLAFFAQTRVETVLCLGAFIGMAFYRICLNHDLLDSQINKIAKLKCALFSILNSQFSIFLATLSAFSLPVLCTISLNRNSDLQGGAYGARGHLFSNIITDFKIMAFPSYNSEGNFYFPYFPYFTWFALLGLITLIILVIKEKPFSILNSQFSILLFLLLLSPQYLMLFDSVSADLTLDIQQRFVLIILPAMSFLGALFIWQTLMSIKNLVNPLILIILVQTVILANTLIHYESFKLNVLHENNVGMQEHYQLHKWTSKLEAPAIFFTYIPLQLTDKGFSAYRYQLLIDVEENALDDLLKLYNGNVFIVENSQCKHSLSVPKMMAGKATIGCESVLSYFNVDTVLNINLIKAATRTLLIYKILSLKERDKKGLLRIFDIQEMSRDSLNFIFRIPKDTAAPWKVEHFLNDEFIKDTPYNKGYFTDNFKLSQFDQSTNIWRLDIIDTITNEKIHSDYLPLVRTAWGR
jgi:hypothetical protein